MEAHYLLAKRGLNVRSYGTGSCVKIPGPSQDKPNIYKFGKPYKEMYEELLRQDRHLYKRNGMLNMLDRNRRTKLCPERFQDDHEHTFDVIFTVTERVYDAVLEELNSRDATEYQPVHVININIEDNHEEAAVGAFILSDLIDQLMLCEDLDDEIEVRLELFEKSLKRPILHSVAFY